MQQPQLDAEMVSHAYLMLLGVASCKDHALAHADRSWSATQMLPVISTIHNVVSSWRVSLFSDQMDGVGGPLSAISSS